jgi:hypothetical protein
MYEGSEMPVNENECRWSNDRMLSTGSRTNVDSPVRVLTAKTAKNGLCLRYKKKRK